MLCVLIVLVMLGLVIVLPVAAVLPGNPISTEVAYMRTGIRHTFSMDVNAEVAAFAERLSLRPGMTLCEVGSADGTFLSLLGPKVMPGGRLIASAPTQIELDATAAAAGKAGVGASLTTLLSTDDTWAPGLPCKTCDAIYSRRVLHMLDPATASRYVRQWAAALKPGGLLFVTDENPHDGSTSGPRRPMKAACVSFIVSLCFSLMDVIPQDTETEMIIAGGFELRSGPFKHPYYHNGYGALFYTRKTEATRGQPASTTLKSLAHLPQAHHARREPPPGQA